MPTPTSPTTETAVTTTYTGAAKQLGTGIPGQVVAELKLSRPQGRKQYAWAVFARVVIHDHDGKAQFFTGQLFNTSNGEVVDEVQLRLPAPQTDPLGCTVSLQAVISTSEPEFTVQLLCSGFHLDAQQISIIALDLANVMIEPPV